MRGFNRPEMRAAHEAIALRDAAIGLAAVHAAVPDQPEMA
jgi:hypothetical protein